MHWADVAGLAWRYFDIGAFIIWATTVPDRVAVVADGFGLGGFAIAGMQLSAALEVSVVGALLVGVVNAAGGGILGSLLMREVPEVFRPGHWMALAVLPGCVLYETLPVGFGLGSNIAAVPTVALIALLRWLSIRYSFRTSPPRGL